MTAGGRCVNINTPTGQRTWANHGTMRSRRVSVFLRFPTVSRLELLGSWRRAKYRGNSCMFMDLECKCIAMSLVLEWQYWKYVRRKHYQQGVFATCA